MVALIVKAVSQFVPNSLISHVTKADSSPAPSTICSHGTILLIDIVGSTALTNHFAETGAEGVETLARILNSIFSQLTDKVHEFGGDVIAFAGDAVICLFPTDELAPATSSRQAAACALASRHVVSLLKSPSIVAAGGIKVHMYITTGRLNSLFLSGLNERKYFLLTGEAMEELESSANTTNANAILLSPETSKLLSSYARLHPGHNSWHYLQQLPAQIDPVPLPVQPVPDSHVPILRSYLSATVDGLIETGLDNWTSEFRHMTVLFLGVTKLSGTSGGQVKKLEDSIRSIEESILTYDGLIYGISSDEKGIYLIAAFGLPLASHEDDPWRAVCASMDISDKLGGQCNIGISTGNVYCGVVGGKWRSEYMIVGESPNLSARLMEAAKRSSLHMIVCDAATRSEVADRISFESIAPIAAKGFSKNLVAFAPITRKSEPWVVTLQSGKLIGREAECILLRRRADAIARSNDVKVLWVEGEAGIGKSRILYFISHYARQEAISVGISGGDKIRRNEPYHAWKRLLHDLLGTANSDSNLSSVGFIQSQLEGVPRLAKWGPLLEDLMPLGYRENEITSQMSGSARADAKGELIVYLLTQITKDRPLLLVFDDAHWIDSASWRLMLMVIRRVRRLLVLVAMRPMQEDHDYQRDVEQRSETERILLGPLGSDEILDLAKVQIGVEFLPKELQELIVEKVGGNPFFCEEYLRALRETGTIEVVAGQCILHEAGVRSEPGELPGTVQGLITARFDQLDLDQQRILKVASVIGLRFSIELLSDIVLAHRGVAGLSERLQHLSQIDLTLADPSDPEDAYIFKHAITQQVVYGLMPPTQRRSIHRSVAEWYESKYAADYSQFTSTLAFHWYRAGISESAIHYFVEAGDQALAQHANVEAIKYFSDALDLDADTHGASSDTRAEWESSLGEAYLKQSDFSASRSHTLEALRLLGQPAPDGQIKLLFDLPRQFANMWFSAYALVISDSQTDGILKNKRMTAHLHQRRAEIAFFDHDFPSLIHATVACVRQAQHLSAGTELARCYGTSAIVTSIIGLRKLARKHCELSITVAADSGDLPTIGYVYQLASVHFNNVDDSDAAEATVVKATTIYSELGDIYRWQSCQMIQAYLRLYRGNLRGVDEIVDVVRPAVFPDGLPQIRAWCLAVEAFSKLPRAQARESMVLEAESVLRERIDISEELLVRGALALLYLRKASSAQSYREADKATELLSSRLPPTYYTMGGISAVAEVFLALWASACVGNKFNEKEIGERAMKASGRLKSFAKRFSFARPRALLLEGQCQALNGRLRIAHRLWSRCIKESTSRHAHYELGLSRLMLSLCPNVDPKLRKAYWSRGCEDLVELGIMKLGEAPDSTEVEDFPFTVARFVTKFAYGTTIRSELDENEYV